MTRRLWILALAAGSSLWSQVEARLRGRLRAGRKVESGGKQVEVTGDESVLAVLADDRVFGMDLEIEGHPGPDGRFVANPIHTKPIHTYQGAKRLIVSYWCEVCYIRFYKPGTCWCCQKESLLDPKDPNTPERVP